MARFNSASVTVRVVSNDEQVRQAVHASVEAVDRAVETWRFDESDVAGRLAAAGLYQASRLVRAGLAVHERPDTFGVGVGVLARVAFEYWLDGAYALLGGDAAVIGLELERYRHTIKLAEHQAADDPRTDELRGERDQYLDAATHLPGGRAPSVKVFDVATALGPLIQSRFPEEREPDVVSMYRMLYQGHSTFDVHPPMTMNQLVMLGDRVEIGRPPAIAPIAALRAVASMLLLLASWVDRHLTGDAVSKWDDLIEPLT